MTRVAGSHRDHPAHRPLTFDEEIELIVGPGRIPGESETTSEFASEAIRWEAWLAHEAEIRQACKLGEPWAAENLTET